MKPIRFSIKQRMILFFGIVGTLANLAVWATVYHFRDKVPGVLPRTIPSA